MRLGLAVVTLKKLQHPEVPLRIYIPGFEGNQSLEFGDGEVGTPLTQVLLGQAGVLGDLLASLGEERNGEEGQDYNAKFFFTRIASESYQLPRARLAGGRSTGLRHTVVL